MLERLKKARKLLGLTQSEFAEKLGLTQQAYHLIECGKSKLSDKHIKPICAIFEISEDWLRYGVGQEFVNEKKLQTLNELASKLSATNQEYLIELAKAMYNKQVDEYNPEEE